LTYFAGPGGKLELRVIGCSICHEPVGADHPLQKELDGQWAARDRQDAERQAQEARRAAAQPNASNGLLGTSYHIASGIVDDRLAALEREIATLKAQVAALLAAVPKARLK
jgi:hypothetical protein